MPRQSAGLLLYRYQATELQVFLAHPGGPYYIKKDKGVWSIPKGEFTDSEEPLAAAKREFEEETGQPVTGNVFIPLQTIKQKGGKLVHAWAVEADANTAAVVSNTFKMEYPYKSGKWINVSEVDKAQWFAPADAKLRIIQAQAALIEELESMLNNQRS